MVNEDRLARLQERALKAEDLAERQKKMIAWLAERLAQSVGKAVDSEGDEICSYLPPESREGLCDRGLAGCAECWAGTAEGEVNGLEYYLREDRPGQEEGAEAFLERKRQEARGGRARVIDFSTGLPRAD